MGFILLFFSTLLRLEPKLADIVAVGTDGKQAIVKALDAVFYSKIIHLRCFIHMKDNIRSKLVDFLYPKSIREEIIRDIFGQQQGTTYIKGLLDSTSSIDFDERISSLKPQWEELEPSAHPERYPVIYDWLIKNE